MRYETIADIFSANEMLRARFRAVTDDITEEEAKLKPDGEAWSIADVAEHVSIVGAGIARICLRLAEKAKNAGGNPSLGLSERFMTAAASVTARRLEAPEMVHPSGNQPLAVSLAKMDETSAEIGRLRESLEDLDLSAATFPHPHLGDMTASEWLVLYGGHEGRHAEQIGRILAKIRQ